MRVVYPKGKNSNEDGAFNGVGSIYAGERNRRDSHSGYSRSN